MFRKLDVQKLEQTKSSVARGIRGRIAEQYPQLEQGDVLDALIPKKAVMTIAKTPEKNCVIVVDGGGSMRRALLGDLLAEKAAANGWSGLIINGVIRDVDEIGRTSVGVQALGSCPIKTEKRGVGERDIDLHIGGVDIAPGDYIYADNNGVIVSKRSLL